jgi:hypothetical protein
MVRFWYKSEDLGMNFKEKLSATNVRYLCSDMKYA